MISPALVHRRNDHGLGCRFANAEHTRAFQTEQSAPGHDDANGQRPCVNIAGHRLWPDPELQSVQAFDLQAAELIDGLDGLRFEGLRDQVVDGASAG